MRYLIASLISCLAMGALVANHLRVSVAIAQMQQQAEQAARQTGVPPGGGYGFPLSESLKLSITIDHFFIRFWFMLVPLTFLLSFGFAALTARGQARSGTPQVGKRPLSDRGGEAP